MISFERYKDIVCRVPTMQGSFTLGFISGVLKQAGLDHKKYINNHCYEPRVSIIETLVNIWELLSNDGNEENEEFQRLVDAFDTICNELANDQSYEYCCCDD